jgi:hypothetical protein
MSARLKPHKVRGRELEEVREKDPDGRIVYHHRTVDTLGKMLRAGTIDQAMHDAAMDFQAAFVIVQLDPLRALPILCACQGQGESRSSTTVNSMLGDACTSRWRRWVASRARRDRACGTSLVCNGACASGRSARDGAGGRCSKPKQGGSWWLRWGCWRHTWDTVRRSALPEKCLCGFGPTMLDRSPSSRPRPRTFVGLHVDPPARATVKFGYWIQTV